MIMPQSITLSDEDSWHARMDALNRFQEFPQPLYVLAGPATTEGVQYLLVHQVPWTPESLVALLEDLEPRDQVQALWDQMEDPRAHGGYDAWLQEWRDRLVVSLWS